MTIAAGAAGSARAQVSLIATAETDYRFRGVSLTNGKPDLKLGVAYDHGSGLYGGGSVIVGEAVRGGVQTRGYIGYLGFARRTASGLTFDLGVSNTHVIGRLPVYATVRGTKTEVFLIHYDADYSEAYAGVTRGAFSAHLYASPNYLGEGLTTAYLDLNGAVRPYPKIRLFGHLGVLTPLSGKAAPPPRGRPGANSRQERFDVRTGAALEFPHGEVQLAWTFVTPQVGYPIGYPQKASAVVLSASAYF